MRYTYYLSFSSAHPNGVWAIQDMGDKGYALSDDPVVFTAPATPDEQMPTDFKAKFEELCGRPEFIPFDEDAACGTTENLVQMIAEDNVFDQPCKFGCRCDGHAIYCHNEGWLYAPTKCRRTWYTGGEIRDEDCPGYKPNPAFVPKP